MSVAYWVCVAVSIVSASVSLGYAIAGLGAARGEAITPYRYALARSLALAVIALAALFVGLVGFAGAIAAAMVIVQAGDAVVGASLKYRVKTLGPAFTSLAGLVTLVWMLAA